MPCDLPILICDDEADMCWVMERILASVGRRSVVTHSAAEALAVVERGAFALAFIDLKLPDMEGLDLIRALRDRRPELPCVLVSGYLYADDDAVVAQLRAGTIAAFIEKPFHIDEVRLALGFARLEEP